jgi:hypothetical protein
MSWRDLWFSSLMGTRRLSLAALSAPDACRHATRLLFACRVGSSHCGSHGGIVGFDPGLHAFRRFHIKARLLSHQDKGLGHAKERNTFFANMLRFSSVNLETSLLEEQGKGTHLKLIRRQICDYRLAFIFRSFLLLLRAFPHSKKKEES